MSSEVAVEMHGGRWKRYPAYRDSGVEWLGEVPVGWEVMKLKQFSKLITKGTTPMTIGKGFVNDGITFVKVENINNNFSIDTSNCNYIDEETDLLLNRSRLRDRDILIAIAGAIGRVAIVDRNILPANTNQAVGIIRLYNNLINEKFLLYFLGSANVNQFYILNTVQSAQANLSLGNISNIKLTYPPLHEQSAIAAFLDRETGRIDTLIEKKGRQVELLQEKRAALISHAVTKGLDPDVKMKDSGVEWLGKVPEHWKLKKLKYLVTSFLKYGANESAELEDTNLPRYIRITDFGNDGKLKQDTFKSLPLEIAKDYLLDNGDILFARSGATVGKTFQFKNHEKLACFAGYLIKASPDEKKILSDYLYLFTKSNSYETWKNNIYIQATIQNIGADKYNSLTLSVPSLPEQRAIAAFLDRETGRIDTLTTKVRDSISKLREYRTALISAAVTGKIDVREDFVS